MWRCDTACLSKNLLTSQKNVVDCVWTVMAHVQKPDFVFRWNGRVHLNRWGCQLSWLLAAEVCAAVVVMLDTPCSEAVWRVLATHSISPSLPLPCITVCHHISTGLFLHLQCWNAGKSLLEYMASHPYRACSSEKPCMGLPLMNCYYALLSLY